MGGVWVVANISAIETHSEGLTMDTDYVAPSKLVKFKKRLYSAASVEK